MITGTGKSLIEIVNSFNPEIKDDINNLNLEAFNDSKLKDIICYLYKDLYGVLYSYYPSFEGKFFCEFNLHPLYDEYISQIMNNKSCIDQITLLFIIILKKIQKK